MPAGLRTPRRRWYGPVSTLVSSIVFIGIGIAAAFLAVSTHAQVDRSDNTQANGITDTATVRSVANYQSTGRHSTGVAGIVSAARMRRRQHAWRAIRPAAPA